MPSGRPGRFRPGFHQGAGRRAGEAPAAAAAGGSTSTATMPQKSASPPEVVNPTVWFPPADATVPLTPLSEPELPLVAFAHWMVTLLVPWNTPRPDPPKDAAATIRPPVVVDGTEAVTEAALAKFVTAVPSDPAPATLTEPALWLAGASENATETVLLPVGQVPPARP